MQQNDKISLLGRHVDIMAKFYDRINNYHKKPLHKGQVQIAQDYFLRGMRIIMSQWGRNGGKTEDLLFIANVAAALNDDYLIYVITPEKLQGKEIYWASNRLQDYAPPEFLESESATSIRITYKNKSSICVDGCENYRSHRGRKPNLVFYDEFQDHNKEFHLEVMAPNLLGKNSSLIIYGTPPKFRAAYYVEFREQLLKEIKEGDSTRSYYEFPTSINPAVDPAELEKTRKGLMESGNDIIWYREYLGQLKFGGEDVVFPKWNPPMHVRTHRVVMSYLEADKHKLKWYTVCDPGSSSCFAVLFACYNPFTQQIFLLDEIYEKDRKRTDSKSIWERITKKEQELYPNAPQRTWIRIYDEQATWFNNEIMANYKVGLIPSRKRHTTEEDDISRIKVLMAEPNALIVSDRCYWWRWEVESYITDENGNYIDERNHQIDCLAGDTLVETLDGQIEIAKLVGKKGYLHSRNGKVCKFDSVRKTHTNVPMVEVEFSDGKRVRCTPNHKFLTVNDEWIEASCLLHGVLIQCNTYGNQNHQQNRARVQWPNFSSLSWREILQSWQQAIASSSLGVPPWAYPQGTANPSFGWKSSEQFNRKPSARIGQAAHQYTHDSEAPKMGAGAHAKNGDSVSSRMARDGGGASVAFSEFPKDVGEKRAHQKEVSGMWQRIRNQKLWEKFFLSSKLSQPRPPEAAQVVGVRHAGSSDTYCMNVEDTHCLAVNGGVIVHNCTKYLMQHTNWHLSEKAENDAVPMPNGQVLKSEKLDPAEWADTIVENSLAGGPDDPYSDYF